MGCHDSSLCEEDSVMAILSGTLVMLAIDAIVAGRVTCSPKQ